MTDWNVTLREGALPATATIYSASGINVSDIINYCIVILLVLQIIYTVFKWIRERKVHKLHIDLHSKGYVVTDNKSNKSKKEDK